MPTETITPSSAPAPAQPASGGAGGSNWISQHKGMVIGGVVVLAFAAYLLIRRSSSSSSSSNNSSSAQPQTIYPASDSGPNTSDYYAGLLNQIQGGNASLANGLSSIQTELEQFINGQTAPSNPASQPSTPPASTNPNPGGQVIPASASQYPISANGFDILGQISGPGGQYTGENVSGGAPVYAYQNGSWQQGFNPSQLPVGTPLATPSPFAGNIQQGVGTEIL